MAEMLARLAEAISGLSWVAWENGQRTTEYATRVGVRSGLSRLSAVLAILLRGRWITVLPLGSSPSSGVRDVISSFLV